MGKLDISDKKILFLGFGAVAKCVLHYFDAFFIYNIKNVYLVDKCDCAFYGEKSEEIDKNNISTKLLNSYNIDEHLELIQMKKGDIIIDLTYNSNTYYFVYISLKKGLFYINTSIEDSNDELFGTSIELQQRTLRGIYDDFINLKTNKIQSNVLIEFGQNPGLIQHYVLYALNELNKKTNKNEKDDYKVSSLVKAIDNYKVGTILMSEIDGMKIKNFKYKKNTIYNTWSVAGLLAEGYDKAELVYGKGNDYIKPHIPLNMVEYTKSNIKSIHSNEYQVLFLKTLGIESVFNSICPVDYNKYQKLQGKLIHHGEIFELARLFGKKAPFMTYVYQINEYANESVKQYMKENKLSDDTDLMLFVNNYCNSFKVFDNIQGKQKIEGYDSIGCTLFCGDNSIDQIFWCGSVLETGKNDLFTATILQVAAGVLSGLSYILEPENKNKGLLSACDLDTTYILEKSKPYLGKFFFTEIPADQFDKTIKLSIENLSK